jgi:hypothetical protein
MYTALALFVLSICYFSLKNTYAPWKTSLQIFFKNIYAKISLHIFITDYFFKAALDDNFCPADIEVTILAIFSGLCIHGI